jgi:hypothetical protein
VLRVIGCQLLVISCQRSEVSCQLSEVRGQPPNAVYSGCDDIQKLSHERPRGLPMRQCPRGWIRENNFRDRALAVHRIETRRLDRPARPAGAGAKQKRFDLHPTNILGHRSPALSSQAGAKSSLLCRVRQLYGGSHRDGAAACVARVAGRLHWAYSL